MNTQNESFSLSKLLFTGFVIAAVGYFILDQCGGIDWLFNAIANGSAAATYRGLH